MAFEADAVERAFKRSGGKCECSRIGHGHIGRCNRPLQFKERGKAFGLSAWEARHKVPPEKGGGDTPENCTVVCWHCHKKSL